MLGDIADARTRWSRRPRTDIDRNNKLSWSLKLLPFSHTIRSAMLNTPAHLSLTADIFLKEASKEALKTELCMPSYPFHQQIHSYTIQLNSTHQHHHSLLPSVICDNTLLTKAQTKLDVDQKIKKWLIEYFLMVRLNVDKKEQEMS